MRDKSVKFDEVVLNGKVCIMFVNLEAQIDAHMYKHKVWTKPELQNPWAIPE